MTTPIPTGTLEPTDDGHDLVLRRTFRAPVEDVWDSITDSDRLGRWFGTWEGEAVVGGEVRLTMTAEEDLPVAQVRIVACDPPHLLHVHVVDDGGRWDLEARLRHDGGDTELALVHHLDGSEDVSSVGPGWEFYLDRLVAARDDAHPEAWMPDFDDYYPAMQAYFEDLVRRTSSAPDRVVSGSRGTSSSR